MAVVANAKEADATERVSPFRWRLRCRRFETPLCFLVLPQGSAGRLVLSQSRGDSSCLSPSQMVEAHGETPVSPQLESLPAYRLLCLTRSYFLVSEKSERDVVPRRCGSRATDPAVRTYPGHMHYISWDVGGVGSRRYSGISRRNFCVFHRR